MGPLRKRCENSLRRSSVEDASAALDWLWNSVRVKELPVDAVRNSRAGRVVLVLGQQTTTVKLDGDLPVQDETLQSW